MKKFILFICFLPVVAFSQNAIIDSIGKQVEAAPADTGKVNALLELSWQLMITGEYEKSISESETAASISKKLGFQKGEAASYFSLASNYLYTGKHAKALDYYFKSLRMVERQKDDALVAKHYGNIGNVYYSLTDYSNALIYYKKAFELARARGDKERAPAFLVNIANVYKEQKKYDKALEYYLQSLELYNAAEKQTNGKAIVLGNIGNVLCYTGDYARALDYFFGALKLREELGDKRGVETNLGNIGGVYIFLEKYKEAEEYLNKALALASEIGDVEGKMYLFQSLSDLFVKKQDWTQALTEYKKYVINKDSLFNEVKSQQIVEMEAKFEVEKKEKALALFKQEQRLTTYKAYFLAIVLLLVSLLAVLLVNRQRIKIKKQKETHELEQQIAQNKIDRSLFEKQNLETTLQLDQEKLNHITQNPKVSRSALFSQVFDCIFSIASIIPP